MIASGIETIIISRDVFSSRLGRDVHGWASRFDRYDRARVEKDQR